MYIQTCENMFIYILLVLTILLVHYFAFGFLSILNIRELYWWLSFLSMVSLFLHLLVNITFECSIKHISIEKILGIHTCLDHLLVNLLFTGFLNSPFTVMVHLAMIIIACLWAEHVLVFFSVSNYSPWQLRESKTPLNISLGSVLWHVNGFHITTIHRQYMCSTI